MKPKEYHVLIIDDEANVLNSLKRLFLDVPYGVHMTHDTEKALEIIEKDPIKVVISDQRMPDITGVEFLEKIKNSHPDIIRILFTGYADIEAIEDSINIAEVYRFINKPWNAEDIKVTVNQTLKHYDLIIENRELMKNLEEKNKKLTFMYEKQKEFSYTVSHELRTPLASIKTSIDIVLKGTPGPVNEDQLKFLTKAKNNVDRLNRLINDILDLEKLESGKTILHIKENDIHKIIQESIEFHDPVAKEKNLYLKTEITDKLPPHSFDNDKISQVLTNLLSNAIKFTDEGGILITVKPNYSDHCLYISVKDSGMGIKPKDIDKLFKKFQQLDKPENRSYGG